MRGKRHLFDRGLDRDCAGVARGREVVLACILAESEFHHSALARKRTVEFAGMALPSVTIGDLVLLKALADRLQDRADIAGVLAEHKGTLDRAYLREWARRLGIAPGTLGQSESA